MAYQTWKIDYATRVRNKLARMQMSIERVKMELQQAEAKLTGEEMRMYELRHDLKKDHRKDNVFIGRPKGSRNKPQHETIS